LPWSGHLRRLLSPSRPLTRGEQRRRTETRGYTAISIWTRFDGKERDLSHLFGERPAEWVFPPRLERLLDWLEERCPHWEDAVIVGSFLGLTSGMLTVLAARL
jgi:hypothetical protein